MPDFNARWVEAMKKPSRAGGKPAKARPLRGFQPVQGRQRAQSCIPGPFIPGTVIGRDVATGERDEALAQQAATADVRLIIPSSPGNLDTVLETISANATRLCEANFGVLLLYEVGPISVLPLRTIRRLLRGNLGVANRRYASSGVLARVRATKQLLHIADCTEDPSYKQGDDDFVAFVDLCGVRTLLDAPLLKKGELIGTIALYRQEVRLLTDQQVELVRNFAAQAVIAIENARLLNELRELLQEQTATSEVLHVISSSSGDLQPVFDAMLQNAIRICEASYGNIYRWDGQNWRLEATRNAPVAYAEFRKRSSDKPKYGPRAGNEDVCSPHRCQGRRSVQ